MQVSLLSTTTTVIFERFSRSVVQSFSRSVVQSFSRSVVQSFSRSNLIRQGSLIILCMLCVNFNVYGQAGCGTSSISQIQNEDSVGFSKFDTDLAKICKQNILPVGTYMPGSNGANPQLSILSTTMLTTDQVVPVVFHLIGNNATALTDAQVTAALNKLNTSFNSVGNAVGAANPRIKFCLAQTAPPPKSWTNSTMNGINRFLGTTILTYNANGTTYTNTYDYVANHIISNGTNSFSSCYTPGMFLNYTNLQQIEQFDPSKYINIYVVSQISKDYSNEQCPCSPWPTCNTPPCPSAACVQQDKFINNIGGFAAFWPGQIFVIRADAISNTQSSTLEHEAGHYLSLYHTFEGNYGLYSTYINTPASPCEWNGDRCCDTPPVWSNNSNGNLGFNCVPAGTSTNTVVDAYFVGGDRNDMIENYMDYTNDNCKNTFTSDQVLRMKYTLNYYRKDLITSLNHAATGIGICANTNTVYSDFKPVAPGTNNVKEVGCTNTDLFNFQTANLAGYTYTWVVSPTTFIGSMTGANPVNISFTAQGHYTITLTASRVIGGVTHTSNTTQEIIITDCTPINNNRSNWYFGQNNSVSFSTGIAKNAPNSLITTFFPTASYCYNTTNGNTIYTNGQSLWCNIGGVNTLINNPLNGSPNNTNIGYPTGQKSTIICPKPGSNTRLFIFTASAVGILQYGVSLYEVDISGAIPALVSTTPINPLNNYKTLPNLNIIPHENGIDYWLLVLPFDNSLSNANASNIANPNGFLLSYLITNSGFQSTAPVASALLPGQISYNNGSFKVITSLYVSPDRKRLAIARPSEVVFANFDCASGIANIVKNIVSSSTMFGCFSPNSAYYYRQVGDILYQSDLTNLTFCPNTLVDQPFGNLFNYALNYAITSSQIGPDGRIYIIYEGSNNLSIIDKPNLLLNNTNNIGYTNNGVYNPNILFFGLPNDIICATGPTVNDFSFQNCSCGLVSFTALKAGTTFNWNFGDGTTLSGVNSGIPLCTHNGITYNNFEYPCHIYQAVGTYTVTLQVDGNPTITKVITITSAPPSKPVITSSCPALASTTFTCTPAATSYAWQSNGTIIGNSSLVNMNSSFATLPSCIRVTTSNAAGCVNATAQAVAAPPTVSLTQSGCIPTATITASSTNTISPTLYTLNSGVPQASNVFNNITAAGVYTVTVTSGSAPSICTVTSTIIINNIPSITPTVTYSNIAGTCSAIITAVPAAGSTITTYQLNILAPQTVNTFTVTTNGIYTITASNGLCITTSTIAVAILQPAISVTASPACFTTNATITAIGTSTLSPQYKLNAGVYGTANTFTVTAAGTYTVTVQNSNGCTASSTVVVTAAPTVSIASSSTLCAQPTNPVTLTATSIGSTFQWQPGNVAGASLVVTSGGIYTVTATNAAGCTKTATFNVSGVINPCNGATLLTNYTTPTTIAANATGWRTTANVTINANVTMNGADIGVRNGTSITVNAPYTLTINNAHLRGCGGMWQGIIVQPGARLVVQANSLIEDALVAVDVSNNTNTANILNITGAIFNKNQTAIRINNCVASTTSNTFTIINSVFTSRTLPLACTALPNWPTTALKASTAPANDLNTPYLLANTAFAPLLTGALYPQEHISLINVGNTNGTIGTFAYSSARIGDPLTASNFNIFDRALHGIKATNANFESYNNVFQNIPWASDQGTAILADRNTSVNNTFANKNYKITASFVAPNTTIINKFFACPQQVIATGYTAHDIQRCDMRSLQSATNVTSVGVNNNTVGRIGIRISSGIIESINVLNNSIYNHYVGINYFGNLGQPGERFDNVTISNNTIKRINVTANATAFVASGINASMSLGLGASVPFLKTLGINSNVLNGMYEGINISNFKLNNILTTATSNDITLVADPNVLTNSTTHSSIRSSNNGGLYSHTINSNTVRGIANTSTPANRKVVNFEFLSNSNSNIICNRSVSGYTGFKFSMIHPNCIWKNSITDDVGSSHWWCFHLDNSQIGSQGFPPNISHDNRFGNINGGLGSGHTMVTTGNASLSQLFVRSSTLPYRPTTNVANLPGAQYSPVTNSSTLPLVPCTPIPPVPTAPSGTPSSASLQLMVAVVQNQVNYGTDSVLQKWLAKFALFQTLANDTPSRNASPILQSFYNGNAGTNTANLVAIEDLLTQGNTTAANALLVGITPANVPETNYKNFYHAYIKYLNNTLEAADYATFKNLALLCPSQNGMIVFNARTMHNMLNPTQFTMYANNCPSANNKLANANDEDANMVSLFTVFPNPTDGGFKISSTNKTTQNLLVELFDMTGKKVFTDKCISTGLDCQFYAKVVNGLYLIKITNTLTNETSSRKILFNK
jgi:hypothetical protein